MTTDSYQIAHRMINDRHLLVRTNLGGSKTIINMDTGEALATIASGLGGRGMLAMILEGCARATTLRFNVVDEATGATLVGTDLS